MNFLKKLFKRLGPGFITGASDDDPSGIATYAQTGAQFGFKQLWLAPYTVPFMIAIQEICGRIGMVTGTGLAGIIRKHYSKKVLYFMVFILLFANAVNIGADLGAMASAAQLIIPLPFIFLLIGMTILTLILEVFVTYEVYSKYLKFLALTLLAYIVTAFFIHFDWKQVSVATLVPTLSLNKDFLLNIVAFLGTSISPYLFFWQASQEVEEEVLEGKIHAMGKGTPKIFKSDIKNMQWDTVVGMLFSQIVAFFIVLVGAVVFAQNGITRIETADQAALALRPFAGDLTFFLFAIGIIGTGLLAVPVLAGSASYAVSEAFGLKEGLYLKLKQAHGFYGVITIATLVGLLVNFVGIKPFTMLYYTAILNGLCAPPLMILLMMISRNKKIMGKNTNSRTSNIFGWVITGVMTLCAILLLLDLF